jgi:hypothetical protein
MKRLLLPLFAVLALSLTSCGFMDRAGSDAVLDSTTAMSVEDGVHLEFRAQDFDGANASEVDCQGLFPATGGVGTVTDAGPAAPAVVCGEVDGHLVTLDLGPSVVTEVDVEYIDYDYGTAALPVVYVVLEDAGAEAWRAALDGTLTSVHVLVDGRSVAIAEPYLSPNGVAEIGGLDTLEDAEAVATTLAAGFPPAD